MKKGKYGYFSEDGKEYIITNPFTPKPWINVISNGDYSMIVSQIGGGFSFRDNAEQNRLTRLFMDTIKDNWGKYFYIRDLDTKKYFSVTKKPIMFLQDKKYEVHHGLGYTTFIREALDLTIKLTMFVDRNNPQEYFLFEITNNANKKRKLDLTSYFELAPGIAYDNHREFHKLFTTVTFNEKDNSALINKCLWGFPDEKGIHNNDTWPYDGFFTSSEKVDSFDFDKEAFIGMYLDENKPLGMDKEKLSSSQGRYIDPCCSLRNIILLEPNETKKIAFSLGMAKKEVEDYKELIKNCNIKYIEENLLEVKKYWNDLLDLEHVKTGCEELDIFTNIWSKYQALSSRIWAKAAYYQISGGIGFRDQLQDSLCFVESKPEITRNQILLHAKHQFYKGDVYHWWLTIKEWGPRGNCSDDFLWLVYITNKYIKETGDYSILDEKIRYVDNEKEETLFEHLKKSINHSFELVSSRGVQLMGDHDWNDGLSAMGHDLKGESFWVNEFLYLVLDEFIPICRYKNFDTKIYEENKERLKNTLNEYGWDGKYFLQGTTDNGEEVGSNKSSEGKIFLNPQIWSVIADITTAERKKKVMDEVSKYLLKDYGTLLLFPAYTKIRTDIGYITRYAPGLRENGGVYTHAATWSVLAYALIGDYEKAFESYIKINPLYRQKDIDIFKSEPYVTPGNSDGPISPNYGKGSWSWYTGSASWMHQVVIWGILGISGDINGININPHLPKSISSYEYRRKFGDKNINISVKRTNKKKILVNGNKVEGNFIPFNLETKDYNIEVEY